MNVHIRAIHFDVTEAIRNYLEKRMNRLEKYVHNTDDLTITAKLEVAHGEHKVEVTAVVRGLVIRAEERNEDMYASIDLVMDKLEQQFRKHQARQHQYAHETLRTLFTQETSTNHAEASMDELNTHITRTKRFTTKPMGVEEAVLQMTFLNHDFFVFRNADTDEVNVLYRRKCGDLGLIEAL